MSTPPIRTVPSLGRLLRSPATWRDAAWMVVHGLTAFLAAVVAEALTNIAKDSGARHGRVTVRLEGAHFTITVRDDGKGGADPGRGARRDDPHRQPRRGRDDARSGPGVRIVIAEDNVLLREGLVKLLESDGHEVVAVAGSGPRPARPLQAHTPREREVLALMAQGLDNATIATTPVITERSVSKHIGAVLAKLDVPHTDSGHRRVLAVLAYLNS